MPAARRHVAAVGMAAICIVLALPSGALASGGSKCKASACQVYTEGAGKANGQGQDVPSPSTSQPVHVPSKTSRLLSHAGKDKAALQAIASMPGYGAKRGILATDAAPAVAAPSALGAAFDLGTGPTILLAILLATAVAVAAQGGIRSWRRRRST
jgi:hypothetical protein